MIALAERLALAASRDLSSCQLCGSAELTSFVVPNRLSLWRCGDCGLYQNGEMPASDAYEGDYHAGYARNRDAKLRTAAIRINRIASLVDRSIVAGAAKRRVRLLDVGASVGCTLQAAKDRGWRAEGVDVSEQAVNFCRSLGLACRQSDGERLPFREARFDVLTAWHVIEHVRDVRDALADWRRVLKPGGLLALETPDADCLKVRIRGAAYRRFWAPEHTYTFTRPTLAEFVRRAGFELLSPPGTGRLRDMPAGLAAYAGVYHAHVALRTALGIHKAFQIFARRV
jgi:2-polyprenyl-3-methyl-5-hydroxy-6-metoxy-1,4-benzoquinol methylase